MSEATENKPIKAPRRKTLKGTVVSDKMTKTIVVKVDRRKRHPLYDKVMTRSKKYLADDPKSRCGIGDFVLIEETRPLSKRKRWRLVRVLEKAR